MITKSLEEYLKTMYVLQKQNGNIRVTDIANKMNCSKPSVNKALNNLKEVLNLEEEQAKTEAERIKSVIEDDTTNKLAKYVHKVLGLKSLDCNYDINQEKCRCCIKRTSKARKE